MEEESYEGFVSVLRTWPHTGPEEIPKTKSQLTTTTRFSPVGQRAGRRHKHHPSAGEPLVSWGARRVSGGVSLTLSRPARCPTGEYPVKPQFVVLYSVIPTYLEGRLPKIGRVRAGTSAAQHFLRRQTQQLTQHV